MNNELPIFSQIRKDIEENDVMLYIKGTPELPQCGFSGVVIKILKLLEIEFKTKNVLEDPGLREGIKLFSQWPTVPQLYLKQEFIGGSDIVKELYQSGELMKILEEKGISFVHS
jgi:monothiol glutaredoxin